MQRHRDGRDLGWIVEHSKGRIGWASLAYADTNREADDTDPARDANARLIAAAPDLLAALQAFNLKEEWIVSGSADSLTLRIPLAVLQRAVEAVAKAVQS